MADDFAYLSPQRLRAVEIRRTELNGRSRPIRMACRAPDGRTYEVIVKLRDPLVRDDTPWSLCLARELLAAILLRSINMATPTYAIVDIPEILIRSSIGHPEHERLTRNLGPNFGSLVLDNVSDDASGATDSEWEDLLTFDALTYNGDRKPSNPNVLWNGSTLYAIDHGLIAPTWTFHVDGSTALSLYGEPNIRLHASRVHVENKQLLFERVRLAWQNAVSSDLLDWAINCIPILWASQSERDTLRAFLGARASIANDQTAELRRVMR